MTKISKLTILSILTAAFVAVPVMSRAADTDAKTPDQTAPAKPKKHGTPFKGKLAAMDAKAMTITVGTMVIHITADTKIAKDGKPAMLADGVVGEPVSGAYTKAEDGTLNATVVHFGAKPEKQEKEKTPSDAAERP